MARQLKEYRIMDAVSKTIVDKVQASNGKVALKRFLANHAMSTGMYEIHKLAVTGNWTLSSTYGAYFVAL